MEDIDTDIGAKRNRYARLVREKGLVFISVPSLVALILNLFYVGSTELGLFSSIVFLSAIGTVSGKVLFKDDPTILQLIKGFLIFLITLTINGVLILYLNLFNETASILITLFWSAVFLSFYVKTRPASPASNQKKTIPSNRIVKPLLAMLLVAIIAAAFYLLLESKTGEPMSDVWTTIPVDSFLSLTFMSAGLLICTILFTKRNHWQLALISSLSVLIESIYYLVWYPSLYGDPLTTLGKARYVEKTGTMYAYQFLFSQGQWLDVIVGRGYQVAIVQLSRLSSLDIYWVHNIAIPFLWALVIPVSLYEITCLLLNRKTRDYPREALLSAFCGALLVPTLITWGANPTGNTLAFLFLFLCIPLILRWLVQGGRGLLVLAIVVTIATAMTHPMPGTFAIVFLLGAFIFRRSENGHSKVLGVASLMMVLPVILVYGLGSQLLPLSLISFQSFLSFENALLTIPLVAAITGIFLCARNGNLNRSVFVVLISFCLIVIVDFYITQFGLSAVAYGAERALTISDFLMTPFIAVFLISFLRVLDSRLSANPRLSALASATKRSASLKSAGAALLIILVSLQAAVAVYQAYPRNEVVLAPTVYEKEAIYYINSTAVHRFVVVSDTLFTNLAIGLLGEDYSYRGESVRGTFGIPEWDYPIQKDFLAMVNEPSYKTLDDAIEFASAEEAYFVISIRNPKFDEVVGKMSEILPIERTFGDGKLHIFKYPVPIYEGSGPKVTVVYDDGIASEEVESKYLYIIKTDVTYSIELTGHHTYNVTNYPRYWIFKYLTINDVSQYFDNSSDISFFVLMRDLSTTDTLKIRWSANDDYKLCGWKEDSFNQGWGPYPEYSYRISPMIKSGSYLMLSGDFTPGIQEDFYYAKPANISTDEYPFITIRWKSTAHIALSYVYFEDGSNQEIIPYGSLSSNWVITRLELEPGKRIVYVMVGISDLKATDIAQPGVQTLYVDYILICNRSP